MFLVLMFITCLNIILPPILRMFGIKQRFDILGCGLTGFCGSKPANPGWIKMLMMYNETRGEDSTGWAVNGQVTKETDKVSKFLTKNKLVISETDESYTIIAHARKASVGARHAKDLAHPFGVRNDSTVLNEPFDLILAMNGTLMNTNLIAEKFGEKFISNINSDTQILSRIFGKVGVDKFPEVLNIYDGTATLLFYFPSDPNSLFVYRDKERPVYCWSKSEEEMYISSMQESLVAIGAEEKDVLAFKENELYYIKNGVIKYNKKIDRTPLRPVSRGGFMSNTFDRRDYYDSDYHDGCGIGDSCGYNENNKNFHENNAVIQMKEFKDLRKRYDESKQHDNRSNRVYTINERYFRNGHALQDKLFITSTGKVKSYNEAEKDKTAKAYFFIDGHMCKDENSYNTVFNIFKTNAGTFDVMAFKGDKASKYIENFKYPIMITCDHKERWILSNEYDEMTYNNGGTVVLTPFLSEESFLLKRTDKWTNETNKVLAETRNISKVSFVPVLSIDAVLNGLHDITTIEYVKRRVLVESSDSPFFYFASVKREIWKINASDKAKAHFFKLLIELAKEKEVIDVKKKDKLIESGKQNQFSGDDIIREMEGIISLLRKALRLEVDNTSSTKSKVEVLSTSQRITLEKDDEFSEDDMLNSIRASNIFTTNKKFENEFYDVKEKEFEDFKSKWNELGDEDKNVELYEAVVISVNLFGNVSNAEALYVLEHGGKDLEDKAKSSYDYWYEYINGGFLGGNEKDKAIGNDEEITDESVEDDSPAYFYSELESEIIEWVSSLDEILKRYEKFEEKHKNEEFKSLFGILKMDLEYLERKIKKTKSAIV